MATEDDNKPNEPIVPAAPAAGDKTAASPPAAAEGAGEGEHSPPEPAPKPAAPAAKAPRAKDWRDDKIRTLTARLRGTEEELAAVKTAPAADAAKAPLDPNVEFQRLVREKASELVSEQSFAQKCSDEAEKGKAKWDDFDDRMSDLKSVVNESDPKEVKAYYDLLQAGLETGELHTIVYELGQDLDEAARVLKLSPVRMGVELTKKVLAGARIDEVSKVPKPVTPISGGRGEQIPVDPSNPDLADGLTTKEWMDRRNAQISNRSAR